MKKLTKITRLILFIFLFIFPIIEFESGKLNQVKGKIVLLQLPSNSTIITILSPQNTTYADIDVPFDCQYNVELFTVSYSLDGSQKIPFEKDKILTDLSAGDHLLEVYAQSIDGIMETTKTIIFTIKPYPSFLVIISLTLVGIIGLILIILAIKKT